MSDSGKPVLEAGYRIDPGDSEAVISRFENLIDRVAANVERECGRIEAAAGGISFSSATAEADGFAAKAVAAVDRTATEAEKAAQRVEGAAIRKANAEKQEAAEAERAGEAIVRSLDRRIERFGRTRAEAAALRAAENDLPELAARITAAEGRLAAMHEQAAAAKRAEAIAAEALARAQANLAAEVRASQAAQTADAVAAERLRASTDPLYAATSRLNAEIAESTRLYYAGATSKAEYIRQQEVLTGRLLGLTAGHDQLTGAMKRGSGTMTQLSFQLNDVVTMAALGAPPFQIFASQIGQVVQVAQMADGGVKGFAKQLGGLALAFAPVLAVASVAGVALYRWKEQLNDDAGLKKFSEGLGLTDKEMKKLGDTSVTMGDVMSGVWKTINDALDLQGKGKRLVDYLFGPNDVQQVAGFVAEIYGFFAGGYKGIVAVWGLLPAAIGDVVSRSAKATVSAIEAMVNGAIDRINALAKRANDLTGLNLFGQIDHVIFNTPGIDAAVKAYAGAGQKAGAAFGDNVRAETKRAMTWMRGVVSTIGANAQQAARDRLQRKANELIADRTEKKDKPDRLAERLQRNAEAVAAQIRNLYALANAYGVSGAAALLAEARVQAESQAIKQRGDVEAFVARQVALAVAQRVSDGAKATAAMRDQAAIQDEVNRSVTAGLVPAERAAELARDRLAELPLLAAMAAAAAVGDARGAAVAAAGLNAQRVARARLTEAERTAQFAAGQVQGANRLAELREELRLVGATDAVRTRSMVKLKAQQEAVARFQDPAQRAGYVTQQLEIADAAERLAAGQQAYNASLTDTADRWDIIAGNIQRAGQGMADAFGSAGRALGSLASTAAGYQAQQARAQTAHEAAIKAAKSQGEIDRENGRWALANSTARVGLYGDMASAAKGFFKEGSDGYKALATAEKVFRAVEFALSVRAMAQDAIETASSVARSGVRAAASGMEAVAKAIASLPFPANLVAGAATAAAISALGISIAGSFGGVGGKPAPANEGKGTVLGDAGARSESLKRSIDQLRQVDSVTSVYARQMASTLRSIDNQIGGFAAQILRAGDVGASAGVNTGFKADAIGSVLGAVPLIGGFLKGLFGTKTSVLASGLYGGAQSVGSIRDGGFDASTYSDIEKKKKFLGLTTSTKSSTQYGAADPALENQFTLILSNFASAIGEAAGPLGEATGAVEQRLNGFVLNIGKVDLKGLTGTEIQEKLTAIFGAAADGMAEAAFPGIGRFQKAGEGAFETLVRVSSTVEAVDAALAQLGGTARQLGIDARLGLADQFDAIGDFTSAVGDYFQAFYTPAEQNAAKLSRLTSVFVSMGLTLPDTIASYRALVDAQDLNTAAGRATYAELLRLAPAFADLKKELEGAKSAADVLAERGDLERKLLELRGDTAALRALDLAKLDASNRALQQQVWAVSDAQEAARAAEQLREAWTSIGDGIMEEVRRIRGLTGADTGGGFAQLLGRFNAATLAARAGDQEAGRSLPQLSQALLTAAGQAATSRQELDRVAARTAAQLEATYAAIKASGAAPASTAQLLAAAATTQAASAPAQAANDDLAAELRQLREEVAAMRRDNNAGHAASAGAGNRTAKVLEGSRDGSEPLTVAAA